MAAEETRQILNHSGGFHNIKIYLKEINCGHVNWNDYDMMVVEIGEETFSK